jgi:hypothetical protein
MSVLIAAFALTSCSLQDNTIDIGGRVGSIYTSQVLENLYSLFDDQSAMPSQFSISKGTIGNSASVTPGLTVPLGNQVTRIGVGGVSQVVGSYNPLGLQAMGGGRRVGT